MTGARERSLPHSHLARVNLGCKPEMTGGRRRLLSSKAKENDKDVPGGDIRNRLYFKKSRQYIFKTFTRASALLLLGFCVCVNLICAKIGN